MIKRVAQRETGGCVPACHEHEKKCDTEGAMSGTRIIVLQLRRLIYTAIFVGLGIIAVIVLAIMFTSGKFDKRDSASVPSQSEQKYQAGVYTKEVQIGDAAVNIQLSLDEDNVKSVTLVNLDESVETMYPLMQPTVEKISEQLSAGKSLEEIVISEESRYTEKIILEAVSAMMEEQKK